ncbi:DegV family protein [Candidatus Izemoplasma sp. B36]|uniref:DegV family protein n=1 Tax=Candidatus Izemoplasma sp. B36 TaxID=3242468 RepID=UPI003557DF7F
MNKIKIISDSTCDLSRELLEKHDISIVPLLVNFKEDSYKDLIDLNSEEMYKLVDKHNMLPKTAAASPGEFLEMFKKYLDQGYQVIYMGIGSKFSATLTSATTAKNMLENEDVFLIDSQNLSSGTGLLLLKTAKFRDMGLEAKEIVKRVEEIVPKVRSQFVIETLDYLYKGGRLSALSAFMGGMLRIKPIIKVRDGVMVVGKKARGNIKKGIDLLIQEFINNLDDIDKEFVMVTHSLAHESYLYINDKLKDINDIEKLYETDAGCVISSHCGKGTIGILYIMK